ncbi:MAG: amidinotransferase [Planctomycetes bacterium]|nr:amidinotransferase [Planctomycetota bacterium]
MTLTARVFNDVADLPADFAVEHLPAMPHADGVLVCPPDDFDVIDVKNPYMAGQVGQVDRTLARRQWEALVTAFRDAGLRVERVPPTTACEDMVFTANQTFTGIDGAGKPLCLLSHMRHESRRREVPAFGEWFRARGWRIDDPTPATSLFEGGGDALWHPGRRAIWMGRGFRSSPGVDAVLAAAFEVPVFSLRLVDERFYHLDTCLSAIDEHTALIFPAAFDAQGLALLHRVFPRVVEVPEHEAERAMACNAAAFRGRYVVIERRAESTARKLQALGYRVLSVDTSEFMKSGGSVFCMKQVLFSA